MHSYTNTHAGPRRRTLPLARAAVLLGASGLLCASAQATFSIDAHVIAAGASVQSTNPCFLLSATVAEPAAGYMSGGSFSLSGGFRAIAASAAPGDGIFSNSFEACP